MTATNAQAKAVSLRTLINIGLLAGLVIVYTGLIGMIDIFSERDIIYGILTLGELIIFLPPLVGGFIAARRSREAGCGAYGAECRHRGY